MNLPLCRHTRSLLAGRFILSLLLLVAVPTAWASVIAVAPSAATGSSAGCSLTDAVLAANASLNTTTGNVAQGACTPTGTPGGGGDGYSSGNVILLSAGNYTFTAANNDWYGPNALPPIASDIVIVGNPGVSVIARSTAAGTSAFRLFYIGGGESLANYNAGNVASGKLPGPGQLTLVNLTVENGLAHGGDASVSSSGGGGLGAGGAIYNQGALTLNGVTLSGNEALGGAGTSSGGHPGSGGGIGATATVTGGGFTTALWPNSSAAAGTFGNGGASGNNCSTSGCTATAGQAGGVGGGGGVGGNSNSNVGTGGAGGNGGFGGGGGGGGSGNSYGNSGVGGFGGGGGGGSSVGGFGGGYGGGAGGGGGAGLGGAVFNEGGTVTALNSTLSSNTAHGGDILSPAGAGEPGAGYGGALFNLNGTITLRYSTLADNQVLGGTGNGYTGYARGGAVYNLYLANPGSPAADAGTTATMTINSSILSGSTNGSGTTETDCENNAATFISGYDVVETAGSCPFTNNDQTANPQLATSVAVANGGPTPTLALTSTSPAINNGDTGTTLGPVPRVDQRGYGRDTKPDVGAYEYIFAPTVSGLPATLTVTLGNSVPVQSFSLTGSPPLTVTTSSSNTTLLPASGIAVSSGCGSDISHYSCTLSLTPASNQTGTTTVTVKAADTHSNTGQQSLTFTVNGVPSVGLSPTPLAFGSVVAGDTKTLTETLKNTGSAALSISGIALSGTNAAEFSQTNACPSSLAVGASCAIQVSYAPTALASASAELTITSNASTSPDSVILSGTGTDTAPTANNGTLTTNTDTAASGTLLASNPDSGQTLTFSIVTQPAHGSVAITNASTGAYTYTPASGYAGSDSFTFKANDGYLDSNTATVSVTVKDNAPTANNGTLTTSTDTAANGTLSATNPDSGQTLSFSIVTQPAHGSVAITNASTGAYTYTPASGYAGSDSFTFKANDGYLDSNTATVSVTVKDTAPTANNGTLTTSTDTAASGTLSATNPDSGQTLSFSIVTQPAHGTVAITNANTGAYLYTPATGYAGSDAFTFRAYDGYKYSNTATVSVTVNDNAPTAHNGSYSTSTNQGFNGTLSATNPDSGQTLSFSIVTQPAHGNVSVNASTGAFTYTPATGYAGSDAFTFKAYDGYKYSNTATVSVSILDTPPTAIGASFSTSTNQALSGQLQGKSNDAGQVLTFALVQAPAHGTVSVKPNGQFTYTPKSGYAGADAFSFLVNDGYLNSAPATVQITINDTAPTAASASFSTPINTAYSGQLHASNPDSGQTLTYAIVSKPTHGSVNLNAGTGAFIYTPASGYLGADSFSFKANDGYLDSNTATVSATVTDTAPVAQNGSYNVGENSFVAGQLKAKAASPSQTLTYAIVSYPAHGGVIVNATTGTFAYYPYAYYTGNDSFTFKANDGTLDSNTATISLKIVAGKVVRVGSGGGAFGPWGLAILAALAMLIALQRKLRLEAREEKAPM